MSEETELAEEDKDDYEIKAGELMGLSIEGYFTDKMEKMSERTPTDEEILSALNEIINENQINK
jgi:hypothetical protein